MTQTIPTWMDIFLMIFPTLISLVLSGVIGFLVFLFKSINAVKEDIHKLQIIIASEHLTKSELRQMFSEQEKHFNEQIQHYFSRLEERLKK